MRLYTPLPVLFGRRLRVLIYARYSTDEQKRLSIAAQFSYCRKLLFKWGITDAVIEEISDEGISGEVVNRPGINRVKMGVKARAVGPDIGRRLQSALSKSACML